MLTWSILSTESACLGLLYHEGTLGIGSMVAHIASRSGHVLHPGESEVRRAIKELENYRLIKKKCKGVLQASVIYYVITNEVANAFAKLRRAVARTT